MARTIHVIGAGLAGLSAAVALAKEGERVVIYEAANVAGGRCRSYHDPALDMEIDNGNHLLLSGNRAAINYLRTIGTERHLVGPAEPEFSFIDVATQERWTLRLGAGRIPWWIFDSRRRVPGTRASDYLGLAKLLWAPAGKSVGETIDATGPVYERLIAPLLLAALNTDPREGSTKLAGAVIRETLALGGHACRPLVARDGLGPAFIDPAVVFLRERAGGVFFGRRLQAIEFSDRRARTLVFADDALTLGPQDFVIVAVPPQSARSLLPGLQTPSEFRAIVNAHFRVDPPPDQPPLLGVLNATSEWIFAFPGRLSVTISAADRLLETPRETLARTIWDEVAAVTGLPKNLPRWQIVRERRATIAALPCEDAMRPGARPPWTNILLAGDWTDTGLPATIEGAVRSGQRAAALIANAAK